MKVTSEHQKPHTTQNKVSDFLLVTHTRRNKTDNDSYQFHCHYHHLECSTRWCYSPRQLQPSCPCLHEVLQPPWHWGPPSQWSSPGKGWWTPAATQMTLWFWKDKGESKGQMSETQEQTAQSNPEPVWMILPYSLSHQLQILVKNYSLRDRHWRHFSAIQVK